MRCFYHRDYFFPLPWEHPFPMDKFWRSEDMIRTEAGPKISVLSPEPATWEQLRRVHTQEYLDAIRHGTLSRHEQVRLGLPPCEELLNRSRLETGGTLAAMEAALEDGVSCNLAGGTHHAFPDRGLGYCVLNDVAIAIRDLHSKQPDTRILVIDTDAHQGNGTHGIFADDPRVFTYSIHVGRNYPAVKTPGTMDVELPRYVENNIYLQRLKESLGPVPAMVDPDLVFWISGADPHINDRFGQIGLTDSGMQARDEFVLKTVFHHEVPLVVVYGGGYNRDRIHTARLHANTVLTTLKYFVS